MELSLAKIVLSLFVVFHGIALGAGWYEHRISLPQWLVTNPAGTTHWNAQAAREADVGRRFWAFVSTIALTLLTILSLILVWQTQHNTQIFWIAAIAITICERTMTFLYFIPNMIRLTSTKAAIQPETSSRATNWVRHNSLRLGFSAVALMTSVLALGQFKSQ